MLRTAAVATARTASSFFTRATKTPGSRLILLPHNGTKTTAASAVAVAASTSWTRPRFMSSSSSSSTAPAALKESYEFITVERLTVSGASGGDDHGGETTKTTNGVGLITLNRPKALNALCEDLFHDLLHASMALDQDESIGCLVLTGSTKAFAAGADIAEMQSRTFAEAYGGDLFGRWTDLERNAWRKPIIAAVNGYALGGGCELAMMCDIIVAGNTAKFGQPEINLGIIPGMGGTQRLARAIGKSKAMHMILTGEFMSAEEAQSSGLVAKVFPPDDLVAEAVKMGHVIAGKGRLASLMAKEATKASEEMSLQEGLRLERRLFHSLFATADQKEGMSAFLEKRPPHFTNK